MAKEISNHWEHGYNLQYNVPLDKIIVDWDTKDFLTGWFDATSYYDLDEEAKTFCFKYYPKKCFPV